MTVSSCRNYEALVEKANQEVDRLFGPGFIVSLEPHGGGYRAYIAFVDGTIPAQFADRTDDVPLAVYMFSAGYLTGKVPDLYVDIGR